MSVSSLSPLSICLSYIVTAIALLSFNKIAFSSYSFESANFLTLTQSLVSLALLIIFSRFGWLSVQPFSLANFRRFLPIGFSFFLYMLFGMVALRLVSLPIYTTLRRTGVIFVLALEYFYLGQRSSAAIVGCVALQLAGALIAGLTDFNFDLVSYIVVIAYNLVTAVYLVLINSISSEERRKSRGLNQFDFLYLNSIFLVPPLALIVWWTGEFSLALSSPHWSSPLFLLSFFGSSFLAFLLNYFIFLNAAVNSALTQTVAGQAKDFLVVGIGFLFPDARFDLFNFVGILIGFAGAIAYAAVKGREKASNGAGMNKPNTQSNTRSGRPEEWLERESLIDFEAGQYRNSKQT
jgi:drug/metabolite transporter (DMT)-like permease